MKFILASASLLVIAAAQTITTCAANNCLRAVRATNFPSRSATRDCRSYQTTTSTAYSSTVTVTSASIPSSSSPAARSPPAYASPCPNPPAYASACSCIGITSTVVTTTLPVTTVTTTSAGPTACAFAVQVASGPAGAVGKYLINFNDDPNPGRQFTGSSLSDPSLVLLQLRDTDLSLSGEPQNIANVRNGISNIFFDGDDTIFFRRLQCSLSASNALSCMIRSSDTGDQFVPAIFQVNEAESFIWRVGSTLGAADGYAAVGLQVICQ